MSRFFLSPDADRDLEEIEEYLDGIPKDPAVRVGNAILRTLLSIGESPYLGVAHSTLSRILDTEVRSRLTYPYRIYYRIGAVPEVIAILHTARDLQTILRERFH